ncbi:granulin a [Scomber scombrus]|uniref:granulin a n=1 Tax=Scomber scombrus TaxID=13677 RepID=UPI002DDACF73|nr:granulin a [Scomber scombrus]
MQKWVVICWALLALVGADECPDGGMCKEGATCCKHPDNGYGCCPFDQAECCEDHIHCCPESTVCKMSTSSCENATMSVPWAERVPADQPRHSKSFRMIKTNMGEEDDNICPDQSRCPPEFSCLKALTRFGCCPLAKGISCSDGKHCCPEGLQCSADSRSCIKKELVTAVLCSDGVSECPDGTTCCDTPEGKWACCPMQKAVCCQDKLHCCPEGTTCDLEHSKCIHTSTKKEMPMWAKLPARTRAEWEYQKESEPVVAEPVHNGTLEKVPEVPTANTVPPTEWEVPVSSVTTAAAGNDVPCDDTTACRDNTTCCKTKEGTWACCPLIEAVCCEDFIHCCPKGKKCNLAAGSCDDELCSVPWAEKIPAVSKQGAQVGNVTCDSSKSCPDGTTCCKTTTGDWACCPYAEAVCCDDHEHCCPKGTTCDLASQTCVGSSGSTSMMSKTPAFGKVVNSTEAPTTAPPSTTVPSTQAPTTQTTTTQSQETSTTQVADEKKPEEEEKGARIQCDAYTSCPDVTTCCFVKSTKKWGCCPLQKAVCCADGDHCCPENYKCNESQTSCVKEGVVIPWYTKLPAISVQDEPSSVKCDAQNQCPEFTSCCQLSTGEWGCCPIENAVCCPDKEHCCPHGYTCNIGLQSCIKLMKLQLDTVPLIPVFLPSEPKFNPLNHGDVKCDDTTSCPDGETCCKMSDTAWGCCPSPNAVCCSDMQHCCPTGYTCTDTGGCTQGPAFDWHNWRMFFSNKKRAMNL